MAKLLEFASGDGRILVAVEAAEDEVLPVGRREAVIEKAKASLDEMLGVIGHLAHSLQRAIADAPVESAEVEFGLKFTGKGTLYVVESTGEASLKVTLTLKAAPDKA